MEKAYLPALVNERHEKVFCMASETHFIVGTEDPIEYERETVELVLRRFDHPHFYVGDRVNLDTKSLKKFLGVS